MASASGPGSSSGTSGAAGVTAADAIQSKRVYLTFDDGPVAATAEVLDALRAQKVTATFFMNANKLEKQGDLQYKLIYRMVTEGHSLGNHGYDHDPTSKKQYRASSTDAVLKDFTTNEKVLRKLFADRGQAFPGLAVARLPGDGRTFTEFVAMITKTLGLPHAAWDFELAPNSVFGHVNFRDWQGIAGVSADHVGLPKADDIILLHDAHWKGRGALLGQALAVLKKAYAVVSLKTLPRGHRSLRYPNP